MKYIWAVSKFKLERAIQASTTKTEADIKDLYIKLGGLVVPEKTAQILEAAEVHVQEEIKEEVEIKTKIEPKKVVRKPRTKKNA